MKILFLTPRFPFPPIGGDKLRFFNIMKYLSKMHEIFIICFSDQKINPDLIKPYKDYFKKLDVVYLPKIKSYINCIIGLIKKRPLQISYYQSQEMVRLIQKRIGEEKFDAICCHLIRMAEYVRNYPIYKILDMTDAQSLNYLRSISYSKDTWFLVSRFERTLVHRYEQAIWKFFDKNYVVSPLDCNYLKKFNNNMNIDVLQNGVDTEKYTFKLNDHSNKKICFIGNMRTFPNSDAVVWFCNEIFSLIKEKIPDIEFYIIGTEPKKCVRDLAKKKGVYVTGEVNNINEYIWNSAVSVAPMRAGAGIQNKILESMALGTPVVTTSVGLEGLECKPDRDLLVADSPQDFAEQVIRLIQDKELRMQISKNARKLIEEKYTWNKTLKKLDEIIG